MSKEMSIEQIQAQILDDFDRLLILTKHGTIGYQNFRFSTTLLVDIYISALEEERKGSRS